MATSKKTTTKTTTTARAKKASKPTVAPKPTRAPKWAATAKITVLVNGNPKRGHAARRYSYYKDGMTIAAYISALEKNGTGNTNTAYLQAYRDLTWDHKQGWIGIEPAK